MSDHSVLPYNDNIKESNVLIRKSLLRLITVYTLRLHQQKKLYKNEKKE